MERVYRNETTPKLNIPEHALRHLLELCTKEAPFISPKGDMYLQIDGVAMGSPLGVLFANFFMGVIEEKVLADRCPPIYCRYVDDIFVVSPSREDLQDLRQRLIQESGLNFTTEDSRDGRLPFLDVMDSLCTTGFETSVYVKETNQGLCLSGESECPTRYKRSTVAAYVRRALSHCSTWHLTHLELERATQVLINNGYPNSMVNDVIREAIDKWYIPQNIEQPNKTPIKIYHKGHMTSAYQTDERSLKEIIRRNVKPVEENAYISFTIYYKNLKTSNLLICNRPKTTSAPIQESYVVYQHVCQHEDCGPRSTYVGMTTTRLSRRLTCHLQAGAIRNHYMQSHHIRLTRDHLEKGTTIVDRERDARRLPLLEALYIKDLNPSINIQLADLQALPSSHPTPIPRSPNERPGNHPTANEVR